MKTTEYLYNCSIQELPNIDEGLRKRVEKSKELLDRLLEVPIKDRDFSRIKSVVDAIKFNKKLLDKNI